MVTVLYVILQHFLYKNEQFAQHRCKRYHSRLCGTKQTLNVVKCCFWMVLWNIYVNAKLRGFGH